MKGSLAAGRQRRFGTLQRDLPFLKNVVDYQLTKYPRLYLFVERFRAWVNWDKRIYLSFVQKGDWVIDVGANVGAHAVFLSHLVGRRGRVFAFEPLPPNVDAFRETLRRRSRIPNIEVFQTAIGDSCDENHLVVIRAPDDDLTQASLHLQRAGSWQGNSKVREFVTPLISLDAHPAIGALARIDFLKIDVEGGELDVLKGAKRTLTRHQPLVYCEIFEKWTTAFGYNPPDLFQFMASVGYSGARVISEGRVIRLMLDDKIPIGLFDTSSDALFFAERHRALIADFDKRYPD